MVVKETRMFIGQTDISVAHSQEENANQQDLVVKMKKKS